MKTSTLSSALSLVWLLLAGLTAWATPTVNNQNISVAYNAGRSPITLQSSSVEGTVVRYTLSGYTRNSAQGELYVGASTTALPTTGSLSLAPGGPQLYFVPAGPLGSTTTFQFTATDSGGLLGLGAGTSASRTFTVTETNVAPVAATLTGTFIPNTAGATQLNPLLAATDTESGISYFSITGGLPDAATQGVLKSGGLIVSDPNTQVVPAQLTFTPPAGYVGTFTLSYTVTDGGGLTSAPATYTMQVGTIRTITGRVFEDLNYGGGTGSAFTDAPGAAGLGNVRIELYTDDVFSQAATSAATGTIGAYSFALPLTSTSSANYVVRVVNSAFSSSRPNPGAVGGLLPVLTFVNGDGNRVGGESPSLAEAASGATSATLSGLNTGSAVAQARTASLPLSSASADLTTVDFGFSYNVVANTNASGRGSLQQFILNSNALSNTGLDQRRFNNNGVATGTDFPAQQETSIFMLADGAARPGLRAGLTSQLRNAAGVAAPTSSRALLTLAALLPTITDAGTAIDGTTQSTLSNSNAVLLGTGGTVGKDALPLSQLNGPEVEIVAPALTYALRFAASNGVLRGVALRGGSLSTVRVEDPASTNMLVDQVLIGTDAFSIALPALTPTPATGLQLANATGTVQHSIIAYAGNSGVHYTSGSGTAGYLIRRNEFTQNGQVTAGGDGITIGDSGPVGPATIEGNLITNSNSSGIQFEIGNVSTNLVQNNSVLNNGKGGAATRLEGSGIHYLARTSSVTGTNPDLIYRNIITNNQSSGVVINNGQKGVRISQNAIYNNGDGTTGGQGLVAIDLTPAAYYVGSTATNASRYGQGNGVTPNDGLLDDGSVAVAQRHGNGGIDYPIITSIAKDAQGRLLLTGYVGTAAGQSKFAGAILEVFSARDDSNQSGEIVLGDGRAVPHGEAERYVGTLTADANGNFDGLIAAPAATINVGDIITATAYLPGYGTSESGINLVSDFNIEPLPVELSAFEATAAGADAVLRWTTASEKNNHHFDVERSADGVHFQRLTMVGGRGNSATVQHYNYTDQAAQRAGQRLYYRLRQVDTDNAAQYSPVRVLAFGSSPQPALGLYPNPATSTTTLDLRSLPAGSYSVTITDIAGRTRAVQQLIGGQQHTLPLQSLPAGTYQLQVRGTDCSLTKRLVKWD